MFPLKRYVFALPLCALAACGSDRSVNPVAEKVDADNGAGITSANIVSRFDLLVGQRVTIKPRTTTRTSRLRWSSNNAGVAGVNSTGTVTANATGSATVTVSGGWVAESYTIAVTAPAAPPAPTVTAFTLQPATGVSLLPGQTQQFAPAATWSDGRQYPLSVTYTATGGTISSTGLFTAGNTAGRFSVIATCVCGLVATSTVDVAQLVSLTISPKTVSLAAGGTQAFSVSALWGTGATTVPPVSYSVTGGSITSTGQYTAPSTAGLYRVVVAHTNGTAADTATVTVSGGGPSNPIPSTFGPGPNAPAWSGKTAHPQELFNTPIPVHYSGPNAAGFKGWQGFDGAWGGVWNPTRVSYPTVSTPLGVKPVLQISYPGSSSSVTSVGQATAQWPTNEAWGVRITGSWSGTLSFERSADGVTWTPVLLRGTRAGSGNLSTSGVQTSVNGVWVSDDELTSPGGKFRVRATSWTSGSATIAVGMQGGGAPGRMTAGQFANNPTRIYTRILVYVDANWSDGGNAGTKFFFFSQEKGNNHYVGLFSEAGGGPSVGLQASSNRNIFGAIASPNGVWMDVEYLFVANTPGASNGIARAWVNGVQITNASDVRYFAAGVNAGFSEFFMDPTYGGGEAPPPRNVFFRIAGWYRESAP